jgi:GntR family transcriptional regulator of vanillate catabolism
MAQTLNRIFSLRADHGRQSYPTSSPDGFGGKHQKPHSARQFCAEGYLEFIKNRGVYVRRFTRDEILEMGRVREVIEGLAARLAAEKQLNPEQETLLRAHQDRLDAAVAANDVDGYNMANFAYHSTICSIANNRHVEQSLERVRLPLYRLQLPRSFSSDSMANSNRDHQVITSSILAGKPDAAEAAMRAHVHAGNQHVLRLADEHFR